MKNLGVNLHLYLAIKSTKTLKNNYKTKKLTKQKTATLAINS